MVVTIHLVAASGTADDIAVSSDLDLAVETIGSARVGDVADAVAERARHAALCLLEQVPTPALALAAPADESFVPLARLLPLIRI
ncbi:MAG TPA: hypothetical protein VFD92_25720 [Candidatus Binatia bacterium]|nr:hypothetical protein [Candidatus Binatia bacterium]